jgi:exonuclease III
MNCLFWNCRGAGDAATVKEIKNLVLQYAPRVLCLVETQLDKSRLANLARPFGYDNCYAVSSEGRSGGLAMYWNNPLGLDLQSFSKNHIDMKVLDADKDPWRLTCIYGEANRTHRHHTWELLSLLCAHSDLPWVCIGDYNEVLRREEHFGVGDRDEAQINAFRQAADVCGLSDLGYVGLDWTFEK